MDEFGMAFVVAGILGLFGAMSITIEKLAIVVMCITSIITKYMNLWNIDYDFSLFILWAIVLTIIINASIKEENRQYEHE